jgi:hypothetical protein
MKGGIKVPYRRKKKIPFNRNSSWKMSLQMAQVWQRLSDQYINSTSPLCGGTVGATYQLQDGHALFLRGRSQRGWGLGPPP